MADGTSSIDIPNLKPGVSYIIQIQAEGSKNTDVSDWSVAYVFVVPSQ